MFTGIVEHQVKILDRREKDGLLSFDFVLPQKTKIRIGASVLINGVCSTVTGLGNPLCLSTRRLAQDISPLAGGDNKEGEHLSPLCPSTRRLAQDISPLAGGDNEERAFSVDYMPETRKKTTVDSWKVGDTVHFETSLRVGDTIDGHFVFGHIDTVAKVRRISPPLQKGEQGGFPLSFSLPKKWMRYFVSKGSVAIDGVSLTVVDVGEGFFSVPLIPHTLKETHLGNLRKGDTVNIECDMLAKYAVRALARENG